MLNTMVITMLQHRDQNRNLNRNSEIRHNRHLFHYLRHLIIGKGCDITVVDRRKTLVIFNLEKLLT